MALAHTLPELSPESVMVTLPVYFLITNLWQTCQDKRRLAIGHGVPYQGYVSFRNLPIYEILLPKCVDFREEEKPDKNP